MRFGLPLALLLLVPAAIIWLLARRRARLKDVELPVSNVGFLPEARGPRAWVAEAARYFLPVATALFLIAAARPQAGREVREVVSEGIDILLAIDVSGSMRCEDFRPQNRLYVAKEVAKRFVRGRVHDRIGLIAFAGRGELISPVTLDYDGLTALIDGLDFGMLPDGTAVGSAIALGAERLRHTKGRSRVLILLTDGINNAGSVDPVSAARLAAAVGVRIYTVGAGTQGQAPFPVDDPVLGRHYVWVRSDVDEPTLRSVADITRGRYFRATTAELLDRVYHDIDALEPSRVEMRSYTRWAEVGPRFLGAGLVLIALDLLLGATWLRRYP
ncbi:MAG TPA: VWA domain-containing protein [Candidatus Eisenbacteria bacterium]|nr:VWA domain-containing protein [Candidatus Eisenbacteria bacterium]